MIESSTPSIALDASLSLISIDSLSLLLATLFGPLSRSLPKLPPSPSSPSPVAGQIPHSLLLGLILPCPQSSSGCGNNLLLEVKFSGAGLVLAPVSCCLSSSSVATHCAIHRATRHQVRPTTRAFWSSKSLSSLTPIEPTPNSDVPPSCSASTAHPRAPCPNPSQEQAAPPPNALAFVAGVALPDRKIDVILDTFADAVGDGFGKRICGITLF